MKEETHEWVYKIPSNKAMEDLFLGIILKTSRQVMIGTWNYVLQIK